MPLTTCPDCDREISTTAAACPHCGRPMQADAAQRVRTTEDSFLTRNRGCGDILIYTLVGIVLLVLLMLL